MNGFVPQCGLRGGARGGIALLRMSFVPFVGPESGTDENRHIRRKQSQLLGGGGELACQKLAQGWKLTPESGYLVIRVRHAPDACVLEQCGCSSVEGADALDEELQHVQTGKGGQGTFHAAVPGDDGGGSALRQPRQIR